MHTHAYMWIHMDTYMYKSIASGCGIALQGFSFSFWKWICSVTLPPGVALPCRLVLLKTDLTFIMIWRFCITFWHQDLSRTLDRVGNINFGPGNFQNDHTNERLNKSTNLLKRVLKRFVDFETFVWPWFAFPGKQIMFATRSSVLDRSWAPKVITQFRTIWKSCKKYRNPGAIL